MKIGSLITALILVVTSSLEAMTSYRPSYGGSYEGFCGNWYAEIDFLYWKTRKCGLDYLWPFDVPRYDTTCDGTPSTNDPVKLNASVVTLGSGSPRKIKLDYNPGLRLSFFKECGCWESGVRLTHYSTDKSNSIKIHSTSSYTPSREHPDQKGVVDYGNLSNAKSSYDLELSQVDFEGRARWGEECDGSLTFFSGVKLAFLDQKMKTTYEGTSLPKNLSVEPRIHTVKEKCDMDAYGIYFGANADWRFANCLTLFGRVSFGALLGNFDRSFNEKEVSEPSTSYSLYPDEVLVKVKDDSWCGVRQMEYLVGLEYFLCETCFAEWKLQLGYELHQWIGMRNFIHFLDHHEKGTVLRATDNLAYDGFFLGFIADY